MIRIFTKDYGRNHKAGDKKDYPLHVWKSSFPGFEKFTRKEGEVIAEGLKRQSKDQRHAS